MPVASFDGPNKEVTILHAGPITTLTATQIYSEWKQWLVAGNTQYIPAFFPNPFGGNPLSQTRSIGSYYFLNNLEGWHLHPEPGFSYEIQIEGDLYPNEADTVTYPWIEPTSMGESVVFTFDRSAATQVVVTSSGVQDVRDAVWNAPLTDHQDAGSTGKRLADIKPSAWGL